MNDEAKRPATLLSEWVGRQVPAAADWLAEAMERLGSGATDRDLYLAVSLAPRKVGKDDLTLDEADLASAERARPGWSPAGWSVDQAARLAVLLAADSDDETFARRLDALFRTGDVGELITFYRGLPLYPAPERHVARAAEGARSNMKAVFNAVAHYNPYPAEMFEEGTWNHMVLKALFVESPLYPIRGLDDRANPALMRMLCDYAHERWAASRPVSIELWRCVGPHADAQAIDDLTRVIGSEDECERLAGALALKASPDPEAARRLAAAPELRAKIESGAVSWESLARR